MRFSIITPSFNQAEFINDNIESVLKQKFTDWEHIIIDGGSTDGTVDILKRYPHLSWKSEIDKGQSEAINKGLRMAKGDIIGWINSDDLLCDNSLSIVDDFFKLYPNKFIVSGAILKIDRYGNYIKRLRPELLTRDILLNKASGVLQPSTFIKREVFEKVGFIDESLHYIMDKELFIRILTYYQHSIIQDDLVKFRYYEESKTGSSFIKFEKELIRVKIAHHANVFSSGNMVLLYSFLKEPFRKIRCLCSCLKKEYTSMEKSD
jgi:glycosyltransferase involved in cell wall biosynthesis